MKIRYLPHTADIRMKIEGLSLKQLFTAGVIGMGNILREDFCNAQNLFDYYFKIEITAPDQTCLLIDFLAEVLSLSYVEKCIFCKVVFSELTPNKAIAEIYGTKVLGFDEEIKAVSFQEAEIKRMENGHWQTVIVFDI